jgi:DivIVA domain-containing protein
VLHHAEWPVYSVRMDISPRDLRDIEIRESLRGYNRDEVNDLLERAAATIESTNERVQQLTERLASAQSEAGRTRETEDVLHRTLLLAQRAADEAVAEANNRARQMLDDADIQSRRLVAEGEAEARRKGESERRRLEEEVLELAGRRDSLLADVEALTRFEAEYRERMVRALETDLFALKSRPTTAPGARPETAAVELPSEADAPAEDARPTAAPPTMPEAPSRPSGGAPEPQADVPAARADADLGTHEVDVRTLFEQSKQKAGFTGVPATPPNAITSDVQSAPHTPAPGPIDLLGNDGGDADVLDDDAFFATLRDAVHDDAPLGPRDDDDPTGDHRFFDQDADRGGFRDVFRRRR